MNSNNNIKYQPELKIHSKNTICWHITKGCNLNCSFCDIKIKSTDLKQQINFLKNNWTSFKKGLKKLNESWEIFIVGGEPFCVPGILDIVNDLVKQGHKISVATNFSYSTEFYKKFLKIVGNNLCLFLATFKPEYYKFEPYLKKAKIINDIIKKNGGFFGIGAVATLKDIDYLYELGFKFRENNLSFNLQVEKQKKKYIKYSKEHIKKINKFKRTFGLNNNNCFTDKICFAGINYFIIDEYANAYRCHSSLHKKEKEAYLGNLIQNNLKLYKKPQKCPYDLCLCINARSKNLIIT